MPVLSVFTDFVSVTIVGKDGWVRYVDWLVSDAERAVAGAIAAALRDGGEASAGRGGSEDGSGRTADHTHTLRPKLILGRHC